MWDLGESHPASPLFTAEGYVLENFNEKVGRLVRSYHVTTTTSISGG